jgi:hypothetical protein
MKKSALTQNTKYFFSLLIIICVIFVIGVLKKRKIETAPLPIVDSPLALETSPIPLQDQIRPFPPGDGKTVYKSQEKLNPSKTKAFYFTGKSNITSLDPFSKSACYNGDTIFYVQNPKNKRFHEIPEIIANKDSLITPYIKDVNRNVSNQINTLGQEFAANGCTQVVSWVGEDKLLEKVSEGDQTEEVHYYLHDSTSHTRTLYAKWEFSSSNFIDPKTVYAGPLKITEINGSIDQIFGMISTIQVSSYTFQQYCPEEWTTDEREPVKCNDVLIIKDGNKKNILTKVHPSEKTQPITISFTDEFNIKNIEKLVRITMGKDSFIFNLTTGKIESSTF